MSGGGSGDPVRVTVNLSARAAAAVAEIWELTGDSKTEAINKALQLYAIVQRAQQAGGGLWVQNGPSGSQVQYRFF